MSKSSLFFISGSGGAGKNTLINALITQNPEYKFLLSHTSRPKRVDDRKEGQYIHVTKEEFEEKIKNKEMLEYDIFGENYYGVSKETIKEHATTGDVLLKDLTVKGVINAKNLLQDKMSVIGIFLTVSKKTIKERLKQRKTLHLLKEKLKPYKEEQSYMPLYDYAIYNTNLDETIEFSKAIIDTTINKDIILTLESSQKILEKDVEKYINKINKNKKLKPIEVTVIDGKMYIIKDSAKYLAAIKTGTNILKMYKPLKNKPIPPENSEDWINLVKSYM